MKGEGRFRGDKAGRLHLLGPQAVMRGDDELRVGKIRLQEFAEFIAMPGINGHDHIVQEREREPIPEKALHQRKIKADAHAVLMAFAVISGRREKSRS